MTEPHLDNLIAQGLQSAQNTLTWVLGAARTSRDSD